MVDLNCEGSATNKSSPSSSPSRHCLIHEFGDLDMPLAVAQLGHVQEHPQELQWTLSSSVELQWNLNRAPVRMELKFSSGTPANPLLMEWPYTWSNLVLVASNCPTMPKSVTAFPIDVHVHNHTIGGAGGNNRKNPHK